MLVQPTGPEDEHIYSELSDKKDIKEVPVYLEILGERAEKTQNSGSEQQASFQHKLQGCVKAILSWEQIETRKDIIRLACGILAETDARPVTNHVAQVLAKHTNDQLNAGHRPSLFSPQNCPLSLLESFKIAGKVSTVINPHICEYPACGRPLAEVLKNTKLAYITDIDENDTLQLSHSTAQTIVKLSSADGKRYDRLWQALHAIHSNIIALHLVKVRSANVTRLTHFPQLKYIDIRDCSEASGKDLAESIKAWGAQSQLTYCRLWREPITKSVITGLFKCSHLIRLSLHDCNLHDKLDAFMVRSPPGLKDLILFKCFLHGSDVDHITKAIQKGQLTHLEHLNIHSNPVGEVSVGHLLEALISHSPLSLEGRFRKNEASSV